MEVKEDPSESSCERIVPTLRPLQVKPGFYYLGNDKIELEILF